MKLIKENEGMQLSEDEGKFYLQYDAGAHIIKKFNEWLQENIPSLFKRGARLR